MIIVGGAAGWDGVAGSSVTRLPQYSHFATVSPDLGAIGAPQLGHFDNLASDGFILPAT